jgi:tetratricopeptide (TPR) repeat protein
MSSTYHSQGHAHGDDPDYHFLRNPDEWFRRAAELEEAVTPARRRSAHECVEDAREALVAEERLEHVYRALEYDPANLDALVFLLDLFRYDDEEELEFLLLLIDVARRVVDPLPAVEQEFDLSPTEAPTPGLRVRFRAGVRLQLAGRYRDAADLYEEMLRLDHHDLIGVRYDYAVCMFVSGQLDLARTLLDAYRDEDDGSPIHWLRVLERFLDNDLEEAMRLFERLRGWNPYVEEYLKRSLRPPDEVLQEFEAGSMDEAVWLYDVVKHAWDAYPESLEWIADISTGGL